MEETYSLHRSNSKRKVVSAIKPSDQGGSLRFSSESHSPRKYVIHSIGPAGDSPYSSLQRPAWLRKSRTPKGEEFIMNTATTAGPFVLKSGEGQTLRWGPQGRIRILAGASSTDNSFSVVEAVEPPGGGAPLHVHHGEAESFYILEGAIDLTCGDQTVTCHAGDFIYGPKDVPHKYVVVGSKPARLLLFFSRPGFEMFFAEGGSPLDQPPAGPPDPALFRRLVERYDMELLQAPAH